MKNGNIIFTEKIIVTLHHAHEARTNKAKRDLIVRKILFYVFIIQTFVTNRSQTLELDQEVFVTDSLKHMPKYNN